MPYCTRCGKPIKEGERCSCTKKQVQLDTSNFSMFMHSLGQQMGIGDSNIDPVDKYERGKKIIPDNIVPNESEIPIRQYNLCTLRSRFKLMKAEGRLQLTNKRILFRAKGTSPVGGTTLQYEFAIDEIAGFQILRNFRFSIIDLLVAAGLATLVGGCANAMGVAFCEKMKTLGMILCCMLGILTAVPAFTVQKHYLAKCMILGAGVGFLVAIFRVSASEGLANSFTTLLVFIIALLLMVYVFVFSFKPNLEFHVRTKSGEAVIPVRRVEKSNHLFSNEVVEQYTGYNEVLPTDETEKAIREIGAMINDIQKLGDYGIAKWKTE